MLRNARYVYGPEAPSVPAHLNFGREMLARMTKYGHQPALINAETGDTMTFLELAQMTVDIALSLASIGVKKGDVVSVCSERRMEVIPTVLGTICVGAVHASIDNTYGVDLLLHRANIAKPKVVFMSSRVYDQQKQTFESAGCVDTCIVYGEEDKNDAILFKNFVTETARVEDFEPTPVDGWKDLALIQFTSGTTGLPKGVSYTHLALLVKPDFCDNDSIKLSPILITREWFYTYGLNVTLACLKRGTTCVYTIKPEESQIFSAIEKYKVNILLTTPYFVNQVIKSTTIGQYDVTSLEAIWSASSPLMQEQVDGVKKRFKNLRVVNQIYGMTEAGCICHDIFVTPKNGSVGLVAEGFIIKVEDVTTRMLLGPNQRGEICIKLPTRLSGYYCVNNSVHLDSEGFFKTGDLGYYDEERYFYVVNRIKELTKYKDFSIAPAELEAILMKDARVREAGVTAEGTAVAALVVLQPITSATPEELLDYLHSNTSHHIRLEGGVHFVDVLPRGAGEKLDRQALHALLLEQLKKKQIQDEKLN